MIKLNDYDSVLSITQNSINKTIKSLIDKEKKLLKLYYNIDENGNYVRAKTKEEATFVFEGIINHNLDENGNPINIVTLYKSKRNQHVQYNITFKSASYSVYQVVNRKVVERNYTQKKSKKPWIFRFNVSLALQEKELEEISIDIREKVRQRVKNLGSDMFSIQQLLLDLNTSVFDTFEGLEGMPDSVQSDLSGIISKGYLKELEKKGDIIFGYSIKSTPKLNHLPTLIPTDINFCITPYTPPYGEEKNPELDTLNYLIMTNKKPLPKYAPKVFNFNWVDDITNQGVMVIKRKIFADFIVKELNPILKTIAPKMDGTLNARAKSPNDVIISLIPGKDHTFTRKHDQSDGEIASFSHSDTYKDSHIYSNNIITSLWRPEYEVTAKINYYTS